MLPTNPLLLKILSASVLWTVCVCGLSAWLLLRPRSSEPLKILLVGGILSILGPLSELVLTAQNSRFPLKFDYFLYAVDNALGVSAFSVARLFPEWQRGLYYAVYISLPLAMLFWYAVNLKAKDGRPRKLLTAYAINFVVGASLYLIVPACGPRYAFGAAFPMGKPPAPLVLVNISAWPNAIPSLHLSTALLFVFFAGRNRVLRLLAWSYLAGTAAATLTFEHYLIDLVVAVPFACFVERAASFRTTQAAIYLGVVLSWLLAIRWDTPALVMHPVGLRFLAAATVLSYPAARLAFRNVTACAGSDTSRTLAWCIRLFT